MIESQSRYLTGLINEIVSAKTRGETLALHPKPEAVAAFNELIQSQLSTSSFADPNCHSWYKQEDGRITNNWPGTVLRYQHELSKVQWGDYIAEGSAKERVERKNASWVGRAVEEVPVSYTTMALGAALAVGGYYLAGGRALRRR